MKWYRAAYSRTDRPVSVPMIALAMHDLMAYAKAQDNADIVAMLAARYIEEMLMRATLGLGEGER